MEIFCIDGVITKEQIQIFLKKTFPDLTIFSCDYSFNLPAEFDKENPDHIFFQFDHLDEFIEYKYQVTVYRTPKENECQREYFLAQQVSKQLNFNTLVLCELNIPETKMMYEESIIFISGQPFLVELKGTKFYDDDSNEKVKLVKPLKTNSYTFDSRGRLI